MGDNNKINTGHARSMINSPQAWSAKTNAVNQWMQMDLGMVCYVAGTVIQPRVGNTQYVTEYTVQTSVDGKAWQNVPGTYKGTNNAITENPFSNSALVNARYVRIVVKKMGWPHFVAFRRAHCRHEGLVTSELPVYIYCIHMRYMQCSSCEAARL